MNLTDTVLIREARTKMKFENRQEGMAIEVRIVTGGGVVLTGGDMRIFGDAGNVLDFCQVVGMQL